MSTRAAVLVAGTAAAVGLAYLNDRSRQGGALGRFRFQPALAGAGAPASAAGLGASVAISRPPGSLAASREASRRIGHATIVGLAAIAVVVVAAVTIPMATAFASSLGSPASAATETYGPPAELRAAASAPSGWAGSYASAVPSASDRGAALIAGAEQQRVIDTLLNIQKWADTEKAYQARQAAQAQVAGTSAAPRGAPATLGRASGYAPGTVLYARITMYGCVGRGGGFCGGMASGITVFEGAAACSSDMPFGTKFTIDGDPTGRTYECLDRGHLSAPWVDVFFYNTADGFAWASLLGGTHANITIVN